MPITTMRTAAFCGIFSLTLGIDVAEAEAPKPAPPELPAIEQVGPKTESIDPTSYARVLYVSRRASTERADGSPERPYDSPQAALELMNDVGPGRRGAIMMAEGVYATSGLRLKPFVELFGGFAADNWTRRNIQAHPTVLDGQGKGPLVMGADKARLDGFRLTGGVHDGIGGAVLCQKASPTLSNNVITGNRTIHTPDVAPETLHTLGHPGAAIAVLDGAQPVIRNNLIAGNTTDVGDGGGIAVRQSAPQIVANVIVNNQTGLTDTTIYDGHIGSRSSNGAGISLTASGALVMHNVIAVNRANFINDGGGIYAEYGDHSQIQANWLVGNTTSDDGGAIYVRGLADNSMPQEAVLIQGNLFAGNQIHNEERQKFGDAEAIFLSKQGRAEIRRNLFTHQRAGIGNANSTMIVEGNLIVDHQDCGIYVDLRWPGVEQSLIQNNVICGNQGRQIEFIRRESAVPLVRRNLVQGGFQGEENLDHAPQWEEDAVRARIVGRRVDVAGWITELELANALPADPAGRPVNVGKQWSVAREMQGRQLAVWGKIDDPSTDLMIPPRYIRK